jgi:hypothetical protein
LTSRLQSFETELLRQADNLAGLAALNRELVARAETIDLRLGKGGVGAEALGSRALLGETIVCFAAR